MRVTKHLAVYGVFFAVTLFITWPLAANMTTHLYGDFLTDAYQSARHSWWIKHALQTGQPLFFQPALNYPDGLFGAWIWANPLEYFPASLFAFVMPLAAAANLMLMVQYTLNGWSMFVLVDWLTGRKFWPGLLGGLAFLAYPALQSRIYGGHVGVLALWPLPLYVYALHRLRDDDRWRWYVLGAVGFGLSVAGNSTLLVYYLIPVAGLVLLRVLLSRDWVWLRRSLIASTAGGLIVLALLVPLLLETRTVPQYDADIGGAVIYSADLLSLVSPSFFHPLYKHLDYPGRVLGTNLLEGTGYIGIVAVLLVAVGLWRHRTARGWLALAVIAWVLSLGPLLKHYDSPILINTNGYSTYIPLPWAFLESLPVVGISRTPGRYNLTIGFAVAIMAGYGAASLYRWRFRSIGLMILMVLILLDYRMFWPMHIDPAPVPQAVRDLAGRDDIRAVFNIPTTDRILIKRGLYLQAFHQQNILTGQFVRDTPVNPARLRVLQHTLDPALLDAAGVDVVIYQKGGPVPVNSNALARLGAPYYEDTQLALYSVPDPTTEPAFAAFSPDRQTWSVYVAEPGWLPLTITDGPVELDGDIIHAAEAAVVPVAFSEPGFYTLRLRQGTADPGVFAPDTFDYPVKFEMGINLQGAHWGDGAVDLWWHFDQPPADNLSRFVHVLDESGVLVAQGDDQPIPADESWMERVVLENDLPPGTYRVVTGWYRLPEVERLVIEDDAAVDNTIEIASFEVSD